MYVNRMAKDYGDRGGDGRRALRAARRSGHFPIPSRSTSGSRVAFRAVRPAPDDPAGRWRMRRTIQMVIPRRMVRTTWWRNMPPVRALTVTVVKVHRLERRPALRGRRTGRHPRRGQARPCRRGQSRAAGAVAVSRAASAGSRSRSSTTESSDWHPEMPPQTEKKSVAAFMEAGAGSDPSRWCRRGRREPRREATRARPRRVAAARI